MPGFEGFEIDVQASEVKFEAAVYDLLRSEPSICASRLLYSRVPVQHEGPKIEKPQNIAGRRLFLFERTEGCNNVWYELTPEEKLSLLSRSARIRASLFNFDPPHDFVATWLRERLFEQKPTSLPLPVAPTREFAIALFTSKIEATIGNIGDMIGWESDGNTVGPIAAAAKESLLRVIPYIMPPDSKNASLYRLVLEHGDFGIHNMSITQDAAGHLNVTSLYDWETGCIVPAILSDPLMAVTIDLVTDENAIPSITRLPEDEALRDSAQYMLWSEEYFKVLFNHAPDYKFAIQTASDVRHLWFALRDWRGDDPENFFGSLGAWAERRLKELTLFS